jgi:large subunit ribosomal protein L6
MIIPPYINIVDSNPTKINLVGIHSSKIREFANEIRKWRVPEPYKGKGVFVGDETITLKEKKGK